MSDAYKPTTIHTEIVKQVSRKMIDEKIINELGEFFKIFGDPTRLKILNCLLYSRLCVSDIANLLEMTHSAISHQLAYLKEFKMVRSSKLGKVVYYELNDENIRKIFALGLEHVRD